MRTEFKLAKELKDLMETEPLDSITVKRLSEGININRQSFYYHFKNIYNLLTWIYLQEKIEGLDEAKDWNQALKLIFKYAKNNYAFIKNTLTSDGRELFIEFLYSNVYKTHLRLLKAQDIALETNHEERKFIAAFYAPSFVYLVVRWLDRSMKDNTEEIIELVNILAADYLTTAPAKVIEYRKRKG